MPLDDGNRRRRLALGAGLGLGVTALHALPAVAKPVPAVARLVGIDTRIASGDGVALTFDDGPHPQGTPAMLEALREHGARAIFFLVGEQVARHAALAAEVAAAGHEIALHCDRHRNMLRLTPRQVRVDLGRARERIVTAAGVEPELHRAPYGAYSMGGVGVVRRHGLRPLLWTHWGRDWEAGATAESIARELTTRLTPGSVLLLHDSDAYSAEGSWRRTAAALPRVLEQIEAAGLSSARPLLSGGVGLEGTG